MTNAQICQIIGLALLATGLSMFLNPDLWKGMIAEFKKSAALSYMGGLAALLIGYLLVTFRNTGTGFAVIVTLVGCIAIFKGLALILVPSQFLKMIEMVTKKKENWLLLSVMICLVAAIFLLIGFVR